MAARTIELSSGYAMPVVGLGTARMRTTVVREAVRSALLEGYRHIDCAKVYGNEEYIGREVEACIKEGIIERKDIFLTSKVWNDDHRFVESACRESLKRLRVSYLDLYLIHWPLAWAKGTIGCPDRAVTILETWRAMEKLVDKGLVRSIGVSNFGKSLLQELFVEARIKPAVNQIELHPLLAQSELVHFCQSNKVAVAAWSPLARFDEKLIKSPAVESIADSNDVSESQVILRWHVDRGCCVIPRSKSRDHIRSNGDLWGFELSQSECDLINSLDRQERITRDFVGVFEDTPFFPWSVAGAVLNAALEAAFTFFIPRIVDFKMPQKSARELINVNLFTFADALRICASAAIFWQALKWFIFP